MGCILIIKKIPRWESKCEGSQITVYEMVVIVIVIVVIAIVIVIVDVKLLFSKKNYC